MKPNQVYRLTVETIGYKSGDAYNAYLDGNFTELSTREETAALIEASKPRKAISKATADENGILAFSVPQTENSADLIVIEANS